MTCKLYPTGAFLHLPRTGGTWAFKVLAAAGIAGTPIGGEHSSGHHEKWAFTIIRNPVNWWCSLWRFQCGHDWPAYQDASHPLHHIGKIPRCDLQDWVDIAANEIPGSCGAIFKEFTARADFILKTESLRCDMKQLSNLVGWQGVDVLAPMVNESAITKSTGNVTFSRLETAEQEAFELWRKAGL
jgi:hypothetical protein